MWGQAQKQEKNGIYIKFNSQPKKHANAEDKASI
jgi:hypothetical protein